MSYKTEEKRISVIGAAIFAAITLLAGLMVYVIMQRQAEFILGTSLELLLQSRTSQFITVIDRSIDNTVTIATRPFIIQELASINQHPDNTEALHALQRAATSFLLKSHFQQRR